MRLIFVRHAEPIYETDTLTEKGWREAELLSERICKWNVTDFYCSPLGRAQDTASCTLKKMNRTAVTYDWLREFSYPVKNPITGNSSGPWDFVPSFWTSQPLFHDAAHWTQADVCKTNPEVEKQFRHICEETDRLLASYGYTRDGYFYRAPENHGYHMVKTPEPMDTKGMQALPDVGDPCVVIFAHFGVICIILSHLFNISFELLAHSIILPTASVSILSTEERWNDEAYFRAQCLGDISHLYIGSEFPSDAGSFVKLFRG